LLAYLRRAGYVERGQQAEAARGRYAIDGSIVEVQPGADAAVDNALTFQPLRVQFGKDGSSIASLANRDTGARLERAQLEPELISSVTGRERAKRRVVGFNDLPPNLIHAITVTEDRSFFEHHGVNIRGIIRALLRRYDSDPNSPLARQGGSSITQQLVKNLLLSPEYHAQTKSRGSVHVGHSRDPSFKGRDFCALLQSGLSGPAGGLFHQWLWRSFQRVFQQGRDRAESFRVGFPGRNHPQPESL
jgi:penicillin-binding protein 1B